MAITSKYQLKREALDKQAAQASVNFDEAAQRVWGESDVEKKKQLFETLIISQFKYPKKQGEFRAKLARCTKGVQIDMMANDLMHYHHGDKRIK